MTEGTFVADVDILTPLALSFDGTKVCQNILQAQTMTFHYRVGDKKVLNQIRVGIDFRIDVGKGVAAYQELSEMMGAAMLPAPEGIDVATEEGAIAYFKYFLEAMSNRGEGAQITIDCEKKGDCYVYSSNQMSGLNQSTYIVESTDHLDFYTWDGNKKNYVHGSAPLGTETIHGLYRSPLGGNFIQYVRTHLEKVSAAIKEEGVGLLKIKFTELAKDPEAAEVKIFGGAGLSYVPDMSVSFDNSGSIHGFNGSLKIEGREVEVEALVRSEDTLPITVPTNAVECVHSYPYANTFEDEQGGGHYHYCVQCNSVFDYGHHEYHEGDEHCHVCGFVETVEAPLKEGVVLPEALSGLKVIESKATGNFLRVESLTDMYSSTQNTPLDGNYHIEFETSIKDEEDSYRVLVVGTQTDGEAKGCLYPMHWVVSYAKDVEGEPGTPVVIYEKISMLEYHETEPKKIDGMGDACHVYEVKECQVCHQEYGYPERTIEHEIEKQANQDGSITLTCSRCHESAVVRIGKAEPLGEAGHSVGYDYVSGNREIYEFFTYNIYPEEHVYKDGVCTVCGYVTTRKQVVVDVSSYVGEEATITLFLDKDRQEQIIAEASTSVAVPMAARVGDSDEYRRGFGLESHQDFIVVVEPVRTPVPETTCDYYETWQIAVFPVEVDKENQEFVISGEASANYKDPWEPARIQDHENTQAKFTRQGDSCVKA